MSVHIQKHEATLKLNDVTAVFFSHGNHQKETLACNINSVY